MKMGYSTRTAPRLQCSVFHWAKCDVLYFMHLEKYILFLIGRPGSRYSNKEWLKFEGTSGSHLVLSSSQAGPPGDTWFHPLFASFLCLSLARSSLLIHAGLLAFLPAFVFDGMESSLTRMKWSFTMKWNYHSGPSFLGPSFPLRPHLLQLFWTDLWRCQSLFSQNPWLWACFSPSFLLPGSWTPARLPLTFRCPKAPSLLVLMRPSRARFSFLLGGF